MRSEGERETPHPAGPRIQRAAASCESPASSFKECVRMPRSTGQGNTKVTVPPGGIRVGVASCLFPLPARGSRIPPHDKGA